MIIDKFYEGLVGKLTQIGKIKEMSSDLLHKTDNYERVLFTYDLIKKYSTFPKVDKVKKSENLSSQLRNQGNQCFQKENLFEAWQYYNLALLYAPLDSDKFYLAISNRSAVFYELKKYNECIKDIERVLKYDIPESLRERLNKRQDMAETELLKEMNLNKNDYNVNNDRLMLKGEKDSVYLCSSSKLEVRFSEDMGRHVVAKEDIKVGEVLADEEPYLNLIDAKQILFACNYCLSRDLNLMPCDSCCFSMYCSDECKTKAHKEYHKAECPLMATLIDMDFTKLEWTALRIVIKARSDHDSWSSLFSTIKEAESTIGTKLHGQVKINGKWVYDSKHYAAIHTLETNVDKRSVSDIFLKSVTAAVFLRFLEEYSTFLEPTNDEDKEKIREVVAGTLLLHIMTVPTNGHNLSTNTVNRLGKYTEEVSLASNVYAFHSLINHSCAPNVVRFGTLGNTATKLLALRPIKKGMQLFDNYGAHHALLDLMSRAQSLKFQYKFVCHCEACINNWPSYFELGPSTYMPVNLQRTVGKVLSRATIDLLERGDEKTAIKMFDKLCSLCQEMEAYVPCKEVSDTEEALKQCLFIMGGLLPPGRIQTIRWNAVPK
ncbi:SET and MYND domain-containing protein 4 [Aricia agestis]|uniref:SET and MYND domain-containing protein 4 n=1 Tax=Aricia agestis TaxID=91739 RepID=UPI001C2075A4|nr:SET and MYND domain-containing protein 4 [Aricia agestis]